MVQSFSEIGVKIHDVEAYIRFHPGAGEMDLAFGASGDQGLGSGLDGFLHPFGLDGF